MIIAFWLCLFVVFYTFLGYGMLLYLMVLLRRTLKGKHSVPPATETGLPDCTLIVAAYNEQDIIREKILNTLALDYPTEKLSVIFVTDGSTDQTPQIIAEYPQIRLMHSDERRGKIAAVHRAVDTAESDILIFTDANTFLNKQALVNIARHYSDPTVGAVAGEKRVHADESADAGAAGEGFYWKYESALKKWDSELYSVVGAAGELFSVRKSLYTHVPDDTILDDFMISMLVAKDGYRIVYEPGSFAIETASENVSEELKRKIRIAAGGIQSVVRLWPLLNIFAHGTLSFQYISHRVLRWTLTPFLLVICAALNLIIVLEITDPLYIVLLAGQAVFYLMALTGYMLETRKLRLKILFIPYYFCVMNYAVLAGMVRYFTSAQSAVWEKAKRRR